MYLAHARPGTIGKKKQDSNISMMFCSLYFAHLINASRRRFLWLKLRTGTQGLVVQSLILPNSPSESDQVGELLVLYL